LAYLDVTQSRKQTAPLIALNAFSWFRECNYPVYLKYDALNSPCIQGNKYWKLYGLQRFLLSKGFQGVCTFGGTYSNHLAAMACWASDTGIPVLAYVRGEQPEEEHLTLQQMRKAGVSVRFLSRQQYRQYAGLDCLLPEGYLPEGFYALPEGGSSGLLYEGMEIFVEEVMAQFRDKGVSMPSDWFLPAGTGGSAAGLLASLPECCTVHSINVLKNPELNSQIVQFMLKTGSISQAKLQVYHEYAEGGYAKTHTELIRFLLDFHEETGIYVDPVYTGKLLWAVTKWVKQGKPASSSGLLIWHTGGLQGIHGFNQRFGMQLPGPDYSTR
jgi:1-aminocyclopropane-1-carboxylate deaminase